jgi:hypothetical protein
MRLIAEFNPAVTGAIANGTAGEHGQIVGDVPPGSTYPPRCRGASPSARQPA